MRIWIAPVTSFALMLLAAACGPAPKPEGPIVNEGSAVPENCCCKSTPIASPDGNPIYETNTNRMECSSKQGTCVDEVQCQGRAQEGEPSPPPSPMTPDTAPIE
jgi:hypothetical protein